MADTSPWVTSYGLQGYAPDGPAPYICPLVLLGRPCVPEEDTSECPACGYVPGNSVYPHATPSNGIALVCWLQIVEGNPVSLWLALNSAARLASLGLHVDVTEVGGRFALILRSPAVVAADDEVRSDEDAA